MEKIKEQIKRFEKVQAQLAILGAFGIQDEKLATEIFEELKTLDLNPVTMKPNLKILNGGKN